MANMHRLSLMVMALILGGAVLQSAGAQDAQPTYPPDSRPRNQETAPAPLPPRPNPRAVPDSTAQAPQPGDAAADQSPPGRSLQVRSDRGIRYVSGGVGEEEGTELKALSNQFNLRLLFAMQGSGEYLAAIRVNILDARGATILTAESDGPWFFAQLPPGDYTVEASATDQAPQKPQRQKVHIDGSRQSRLNFRWH